MEGIVFKIYKLELSTGVIKEANMEFESSIIAKDKCFELNSSTAIYDQNNIKYFFFYAYYNNDIAYASFRSQKELQVFALEKLKVWNDELNKMKALYIGTILLIMQGGLNKEEAV